MARLSVSACEPVLAGLVEEHFCLQGLGGGGLSAQHWATLRGDLELGTRTPHSMPTLKVRVMGSSSGV